MGIDRGYWVYILASQIGGTREKRLKKWNRAWKIRLIEESNPDWRDLYPGIESP
jgi:predicted GIY-YIG superfamily endonuclease